MIIRIARIFMLVLAFSFLVGDRPAPGDESSAPMLSPDGQSNAKKNPLIQKKPQPSVLSKVATGTKKFFSNVGDALSMKKSPSQKTVTPTNPYFKPAKEESKPSWFSSMFHKEETKKQTSPSDWINQQRLD